jgi:hypothetical protein
MAFTVVGYRSLRLAKVREHYASLGKSGLASIAVADLEAVGVKSRAVVLADADTFRLGLRAPRSGEADTAATVGGKGKDKRRSVNLTPALRTLGVKPAEVAGRYAVAVHREDKQPVLLALNLERPKRPGKGA